MTSLPCKGRGALCCSSFRFAGWCFWCCVPAFLSVLDCFVCASLEIGVSFETHRHPNLHHFENLKLVCLLSLLTACLYWRVFSQVSVSSCPAVLLSWAYHLDFSLLSAAQNCYPSSLGQVRPSPRFHHSSHLLEVKSSWPLYLGRYALPKFLGS